MAEENKKEFVEALVCLLEYWISEHFTTADDLFDQMNLNTLAGDMATVAIFASLKPKDGKLMVEEGDAFIVRMDATPLTRKGAQALIRNRKAYAFTLPGGEAKDGAKPRHNDDIAFRFDPDILASACGYQPLKNKLIVLCRFEGHDGTNVCPNVTLAFSVLFDIIPPPETLELLPPSSGTVSSLPLHGLPDDRVDNELNSQPVRVALTLD